MKRLPRLLREVLLTATVLGQLIAPTEALADSTYTTFVQCFSPDYFWPLETNGVAVTGGQNMSATGTVTFGQSISTHVAGFSVATGATMQANTVSPFPGGAPIAWTTLMWVKNTTAGGQPTQYLLNAYYPATPFVDFFFSNTMFSPTCASNQLQSYIGTAPSIITTSVCASGTQNDGLPHLLAISCLGTTGNQGNCIFYLDGTSQGSETFDVTGASAVNLAVGNAVGAGGPAMLGVAGNVALWRSQALNQVQLRALTACGNGTGPCSCNGFVASGLLMWD